MNMYPLNEINNKLDKFKEDMDWVIDRVQQAWDSITWLVGFAKRVEPRLDRLELYADLLPGSQATIEDLKVENVRLRNRQHNTAVLRGNIVAINPQANPPIVHIVHADSEYELYVPQPLFETASLQVGQIIVAEARLRTHQIPRRGRTIVFFAERIEIKNRGTVDDISEAGYNDN